MSRIALFLLVITSIVKAAPSDCEVYIDKIRLTVPTIQFRDRQYRGAPKALSAQEVDLIADYLRTSRLKVADFVELFNRIDASIPVRQVHTVLAIINMHEVLRTPVSSIIKSLREFKVLVAREFVRFHKKNPVGFHREVTPMELTWEETIPLYQQFSVYSANQINLDVSAYANWSLANGVDNKESLVANARMLNQFELDWGRVRMVAPQLITLEFSQPAIGFATESTVTSLDIDQAIVVMGLLKRSGVELGSAKTYVENYAAERKIKSASDLISSLANDPPAPEEAKRVFTLERPDNYARDSYR